MRLALASLRYQSRHYTATAAATALGVAFVTTVLIISASLTAGITALLSGDLGRYAAIVSASQRPLTDQTLATVRADPWVASVRAERSALVRVGSSTVTLLSPPSPGGPERLVSGRYPRTTREATINTTFATTAGLGIGDRFTPYPFVRKAGAGEPLEVVGVVDLSQDPRTLGVPVAVATPAAIAAVSDQQGYDALQVIARDGHSAAEVADRLQHLLGPAARVRTGDQVAEEIADQAGQGIGLLRNFLLGFSAVAVFASALIIANTMTIMHARRSRQTALLRCVGATRRQLTLSALAEAAMLGLVSSATGLALGVALGAASAAVLGWGGFLGPVSFAVPGSALWVPPLLGVSMTVGAGLWPVIRAGRVAPLTALYPQPPVRIRSRLGLLRISAGLGLIALGIAAMGYAATQGDLVTGIAGGVVSFLGVLLAGSLLVPWTARVLGAAPARTAGVPGALAVDNTIRNPGRAGATAAVLLVSVTLVVMTMVGRASVERSVLESLDQTYPVDVVVAGHTGRLPERALAQLARIDGVSAAAGIPGALLRVAGRQQRVNSLPPEAASVLRAALRVPAGIVLASADSGLRPGSRVTVRGPGGTGRYLVRQTDDAFGLLLPEADLARLSGDADHLSMVLLRLADPGDAQTLDQIRRVIGGFKDADIGGSATERASIATALDIAEYVVLGLLAVSVLIAVIGVANTLSLSVLERRRESALLRALGATRGQLRAMLAIEGALLALVGTALGTVLGIGYGVAGVATVLANNTPVRVDLPWPAIGLVGLGAVLAGVLASALPGRRAAAVAPAAALATE